MFVRGSGGSQRHRGLLWHIRSSSLEQLAEVTAMAMAEAVMVAVEQVAMLALQAAAVLLVVTAAVSMAITAVVPMAVTAAMMDHRCDKSTPCSELQSLGAGLL